MATDKPITIALADSQYLVRLGLRHILEGSGQFSISFEAPNQDILLEKLGRQQVQVLILDHRQPNRFDENTILAVKEVSPQTNILIISNDDNRHNIYQVLENGVNSFLTKECDETEILDAVMATAKNERFFCSKILNYILEKSFNKSISCIPSPLSQREVEIVRLIAKGLIAKEIADRLNLSTHTVYTHRKNIMSKLKVKSASELVLYAVNNGIVDVN